MQTSKIIVTILVVFGALPSTSHAATLFDNGTGLVANGFFADTEYNQLLADDFVFGSTATVGVVTWTGTYFNTNIPASPDGFRIYFFADAGGTPGTLIDTQTVPVSRVDSGFNDIDFGMDIYSYSATIAPVTLVPGTYWLGLINDTTTTSARWIWAGALETAGADSRVSIDNGVTFPAIDDVTRKNFTLSTVPEPSAALLAAVGSLFLLRRTGRRNG